MCFLQLGEAANFPFGAPPSRSAYRAFQVSLQQVGKDFTRIARELGLPSAQAAVRFYYDWYKPWQFVRRRDAALAFNTELAFVRLFAARGTETVCY